MAVPKRKASDARSRTRATSSYLITGNLPGSGARDGIMGESGWISSSEHIRRTPQCV
ncbi:hypothetical protein EMGR_008170 [Emarellia grisea]